MARRWPRSKPRSGTAAAEPLVALARAWVHGARPDPALTDGLPAWERLVGDAEVERLAPLLHSITRRSSVPASVCARLRSAWVAFGRQHLLGVAQLAALRAAFERAAIPLIPLKGPLLGEALYGEPGLRPFTDLDLLVHRADVARAVALLGTLGYRALEYERPLAYELAHAAAACFVPAGPDSSALPIDLHWALVGFPGGVTPAGLDVEEVWRRAVVRDVGGRPVLALCREDLLLYLALHLAIHHPRRGLAWQLDIALLLRRHGGELDWARVVECARRWGLGGAVYFALRVVDDRLAAAVPQSVLARLRPARARGLLLDRIGRNRDEHGRLDRLVAALALDRASDVVRLLAAAVCPRPAWVRSRYATPSAAAGYRVHYGRLLGISARFLA